MPDRRECIEQNDAILRYIRETPSLDIVIITAAWSSYTDPGTLVQMDGSPTDLLKHLVPLVDNILAAKRRVVLLAGLPTPKRDVPWTIAMSRMLGYSNIDVADSVEFPILGRVNRGAEVFDLAAILCNPTCALSKGETIIYSDNNHLTETAAREIIGPALPYDLLRHRK